MAGNPKHRGWENTVLGHIEIDGDRLVANTNSAERAAKLREIVGSLGRLPLRTAILLTTLLAEAYPRE